MGLWEEYFLYRPWSCMESVVKSDNKNIDWLGKPYYSLNAYFKHVYGQKIYKIAVDAGLTCPNRDGKLDTRGCIFCSAGGSGDFATKLNRNASSGAAYEKSQEFEYLLDADSVIKQINENLKKFNKSVGDKFVIYFQAFTNTYGDIDYLRKIWRDALSHEDVVGISIATRPDCLGDEVLGVLSELQKTYCDMNSSESSEECLKEKSEEFRKKFIWVELGLQTIHDKTAEYIRRHYSLATYDEAIEKLSLINIPYITHIILGLPNETEEMMLSTVRYVNRHKYKPFGIKLQLLHVLMYTDLALDYEAGLFKELELEEYIDIVIKCLENISPDVVIHRVTGDGPKNILIAPKWSGNKKVVLNTLHKRMKELGAKQGDMINHLLQEGQ